MEDDEITPSMTSIGLYLADVSRIPRISHDETVILISRAQSGDKEARHRVIEANLRLVIYCAKRYGVAEVPILDHIQNGFFGLVKAVERFDTSKGYRFGTYAVWWIRRFITYETEKTQHLIYLSSSTQTYLNKIEKLIIQWHESRDGEPTIEYFAKELHISYKSALRVLECRRQIVSLDDLRGYEIVDASISDVSPDILSASEDYVSLSSALSTLSERELLVVSLRYGLADNSVESYVEIGRRFGVTMERVRQIHARALRKLYLQLR